MGVTMSDLILRGGTVVDGTGQPGRAADVLIQDGVIAEIGSLRGRRADREIDAEGHVVSPGFIDVTPTWMPKLLGILLVRVHAFMG